MKRIPIAAIALFATAASAGDASGIDCNNAMAQMDMNICAGKDYRTADKTLNDVYSKLMTALDDAGYRAKLKTAEKAWIQYRDSECTFEAAQSEGGSIYPMEYSACAMHLTGARTKALQTYLDCWKNADKCGG